MIILLLNISELRDQLRKSRLDEDKALIQVQKVKTRLEEVEEELRLYQEGGVCLETDIPNQTLKPDTNVDRKLSPLVMPRFSSGVIPSPTGLFGSAANHDTVNKMNTQLIQVIIII